MRRPALLAGLLFCLVSPATQARQTQAADTGSKTDESSELRLNPETGLAAAVPVMSWRDIPFRTIVRQRYDFSCGSAAVATLLTYHYHTPTTEAQAFSVMWGGGNQGVIRRKGFSLLDMKKYLVSRGFNAQGFKITLAQLQASQIPVIVLVEVRGFRHFVVVKGARDGRILIGDPIRGLMNVSSAEFAQVWSGIVLAIAPSGTQVAPVFNGDNDWRKWATAPVDSHLVDRSIGELTSNFPPIFQLTPVTYYGAGYGLVP